MLPSCPWLKDIMYSWSLLKAFGLQIKWKARSRERVGEERGRSISKRLQHDFAK